MVRKAGDSIIPLNVPQGFPVVMGYIDGYWPDADAMGATHPGATLIRITTNPAHNAGDMLDVEIGDATPEQAPGWVSKRRASGHKGPIVYFAESARSKVLAEFKKQGVALPYLFSAAYPGIGPKIPPGDVGHQWIDRGPYDESVVVDYLFGIDPPQPVPPTPHSVSIETEHMEVLMSLAANKQDAFNCQVREWWATYRTDTLTSKNVDILWYVYNVPVANKGWGGSIDAVLANIIDGATVAGLLRPEWKGAA